jgi:anti-anti-sigma factor
MIDMTVASDASEVVCVRCKGDMTQVYYQLGNPLEAALGPTAFSRKVILKKVILNLEQVDFLDSSALSWLVASHKRYQQMGGKLVLCAIPPRIEQILQFCKIDRLFSITEDETSARQQLEREDP